MKRNWWKATSNEHWNGGTLNIWREERNADLAEESNECMVVMMHGGWCRRVAVRAGCCFGGGGGGTSCSVDEWGTHGKQSLQSSGFSLGPKRGGSLEGWMVKAKLKGMRGRVRARNDDTTLPSLISKYSSASGCAKISLRTGLYISCLGILLFCFPTVLVKALQWSGSRWVAFCG